MSEQVPQDYDHYYRSDGEQDRARPLRSPQPVEKSIRARINRRILLLDFFLDTLALELGHHEPPIKKAAYAALLNIV